MARTKKVGITGRFGARYGRKAKRSVKKDLMSKDKLLEFGNARNAVQYLLVAHTFHKLQWLNLQPVTLKE